MLRILNIIRRYSDIQQKRLTFLRQKKIFENDKTMQKIEFARINDISVPDRLREHYKNCRDRLDRLIRKTGDFHSNIIPDNVQTFEQFCDKSPIWKNKDKSFVFFRDHPSVLDKNVLAQRSQLSGLCYIHGPDMLQHYLVSMNTKRSAGMIDISKMIRETFDAEQLRKHIFEDMGGNSLSILRNILMPGSIIKTSDASLYYKHLIDYGPGLISQFTVYKDFYNANKYIHAGMPDLSNKIGYHSMVLIGISTDNTKRYLLQNWWKEKQFIEVDDIYLEQCGPIIYFVKTPQSHIPKKFKKNWAMYAENENLDKPETYAYLEK